MKKIILASFILFGASSAYGAIDLVQLKQYCKDQFCDKKLTHTEQVEEAIRHGNVKQVMKLVKAENTNPIELAHYIKVSHEHFGLAPEAKLVAKTLGILKIALGFAILYKAYDHFRDKWGIYNSDKGGLGGFKGVWNTWTKRWFVGDKPDISTHVATPIKKSEHFHNILLDIAALGALFSAKGGLDRAFGSIKPKCEVKDHLLIQLYLNQLAKPQIAS